MVKPIPDAGPLAAVIFDFDGVVLDSEPQHQEAFRRLFEKHGVAFSETPDDFTGIPARDNIRRVYRKAGIPLSDTQMDALNHERDTLYLAVMQETGVRTLPGAKQLLASLTSKKIPVALASSTNSAVLAKLLPLIRLQDAFDAVVGGDHVARGKPAPDIFLKAAEELGVPPRHCIVIEDANAGVQAANAAGMRVLMVRNDRIRQQKEKANRFVDSLVGVSPDFLASL